jgi:drug/metabolite transporter (DMT)-like permease
MPLNILILVLFSSFLHACWNYLAKTIPGGAAFVWLLALVMSVVLLPLFVWQIAQADLVWNATNIFAVILTGILHTIYFLVLQKGYQEADLSVVYPLARGLGPVLTGIGTFLFLGEKITFYDLIGLMLVGIGALIIGGFSFKTILQRTPQNKDERLKKGIIYGLSTGFLIACYTIFDGFCVTKLAIAPILIEYTAHPIRLMVLLPHALKNQNEVKDIWKNNWLKILIISTVSPLAFILVLYAMKSAPIHTVAPIREFSIVIGVILGAKFLKEKEMKSRLIGSVLILAGIIFLAFK